MADREDFPEMKLSNQEFLKDFFQFKNDWTQENASELSQTTASTLRRQPNNFGMQRELDPKNSKILKSTVVRILPVAKVGRLTRENLKILENAPDKEIMQELKQVNQDIQKLAPQKAAPPINYKLTERKPPGVSFGKPLEKQTKSRIPKEETEPALLYPSIDFAKGSLHKSKTVWKQPIKKETKPAEKGEPSVEVSVHSQCTMCSRCPTKHGDSRAIALSMADASTVCSTCCDLCQRDRQNKGVSIAPSKYATLTDKQLERVLRMEFRKNAHLFTDRAISNIKYTVVDKNVHGTKITNKQTESRLKEQKDWERVAEPSAVSYNTRQEPAVEAPKWTFSKGQRGEKSPEPDFRKPINPDDAITRKNPQVTKIVPPPEISGVELERAWEEQQRGPGHYDPQFGLTEMRLDKGAVEIKRPYFEAGEKINTDGQLDIYPNFNVDKPNKMVFKYHKPTDQKPKHIPDKELYPEKWVYYDVDLDVVREELAKNISVTGGKVGEKPQEFRERAEFQQLLEEHIRRINDRRPEHGDYERPFMPEKEPTGVEFEKQLGREDKQIDDDEDLEGDILVLDPEKIGRRLPDIKFDKQLGRQDPFDGLDSDRDELILEDQINAVRPRKNKGVPDFSKQTGREEQKNLDDDEVFIVDLPEDPIPKDPSQPRPVAFDFGKGADRFNHETEKLMKELDLEDDVLELEPKLPERKIKGVLPFDKVEERWKEKLPEDPLYEDLPINELDNDVVGSLVKATKPHVSVPDFKRYVIGDKDKNLTAVVEAEETKHKAAMENKKTAKDKFKVSNHFAAKKKPVAKGKKKQLRRSNPEFASAEDEVNTYMRELGLL